ncbi:hypothetical protein N1851_018715 [Merluccius polli]|uniref:Uncharacterized protein n=1 Tax=Merluccius polli TaxID=89951 RepID=A0AA47MN58_MERPO|nr:hypothetical protein N1851_018715 [Merluccius polli]
MLPLNLFYLSILHKEQTCLAINGPGNKLKLNIRTFCRLVSDFKVDNSEQIRSGTGGGPPSQDLTPAEELALHLNKGRPVMEGIQGGTVTDSVPATETVHFIQVSGNTL